MDPTNLSPSSLPFSGRVALVAGCAGAIGLAIAEALVAQGAIVYVAGSIVETPKQRWRLARAGPGLCIVMPALRTSIALSEEFGQSEQHLHILVASAEAAPTLALAHQHFLLKGSAGTADPAHVVAVGRLMANSDLEELRSEGVVVDSVEPEARFGGTQEDHASDVARMVLFVCDRTPACDAPSTHKFEEPSDRRSPPALAVQYPLSRL